MWAQFFRSVTSQALYLLNTLYHAGVNKIKTNKKRELKAIRSLQWVPRSSRLLSIFTAELFLVLKKLALEPSLPHVLNFQ